MSKIGLWSDAVGFPNLPLMKIASYHKIRGDTVKLIDDWEERFDIAYCSKTFNLPTIKKIPQLTQMPRADEIHLGGTGFGIEVKDGREIYNIWRDSFLTIDFEECYPDYGLYPGFTQDTAFGFLTRGCPNACPFCVVSEKEGRRSIRVGCLSDFWYKQRNITIMDPNILANDKATDLLLSLIKTGANIDFKQGIDARFIDTERAKLLSSMKIDIVRFAFDLMKNEATITRGLTQFRKYFKKSDRHCKVFILTNFNTTFAEDWYRTRKVIELGFRPDIRIYQKGTHSRFLTDLSRWANSRIYRTCTFEDYIPRKDGKRCGVLYPEILRL